MFLVSLIRDLNLLGIIHWVVPSKNRSRDLVTRGAKCDRISKDRNGPGRRVVRYSSAAEDVDSLPGSPGSPNLRLEHVVVVAGAPVPAHR